MGLKMRIDEVGTHFATLHLIGRIDNETSPSLDQEIQELLKNKIHTIILDMKEVSFVSSAGIGIIIKAQTTLRKKKGELVMMNMQDQVKKVFEIIRMLPALNVFESVEELDAYLAKVQNRILEDGDFSEV